MADDQQFARSKVAVATTPRAAARIPIFAPTRRPRGVTESRVETPWGSAIVSGRLGQQHRDLLDAARLVADCEQWTADGRLHLKIDPAKLRSALGGDVVNNRLILNWIEDLRKARLEVHIGDRVIIGGLISEYELSADTTTLRPRPGALGGDRHFMRMSFSTGWSKLIEGEQAMYYPLECVVELKHGFSQAVARFCLSHRSVKDTVAAMMEKVGATGRTRDYKGALTEDAERLFSLGIVVDGDAVRYLPDARPKSGEKRGGATKVR